MGRGEGALAPHELPSENDIAQGIKDAIAMEDKVSLKTWKGQGAPGLKAAKLDLQMPPRRNELMSFVQAQSSGEGPGWKRLMEDREAKEAMAAIRARVDTLLKNGRAAIEGKRIAPDPGSLRLNQRERVSGQGAFGSSALNPLSSDSIERGWDARVRKWTGRDNHFANLEREPTSFWCQSWGGSASDKAVDSEFHGYVKPKGVKHYAPIAEHTRGWR